MNPVVVPVRAKLEVLGSLTLGPSGPQLLDFFQGPAATPLADHPMDVGPGWTHYQGAVSLLDGRAQVVTPEALYLADSALVDVAISAVLRLGAVDGNHGACLLLRGEDDSNFLQGQISGDNHLYLYSCVGGSFHALAAADWTADTLDHTLVFRAVGNVLTLSVDGEELLNITSTLFPAATLCGIRGAGSGPDADSWAAFSAMPA